MSLVKERVGKRLTYIATCDICGAELPPAYEFYDAIDAKTQNGWKARKIDGEWCDFCPECWGMRGAYIHGKGLERGNGENC